VTAVKRVVARGLAKRKLKPIRIIGIDEASRKKGRHYLTLVYDLARRLSICEPDGKSGAAWFIFRERKGRGSRVIPLRLPPNGGSFSRAQAACMFARKCENLYVDIACATVAGSGVSRSRSAGKMFTMQPAGMRALRRALVSIRNVESGNEAGGGALWA